MTVIEALEDLSFMFEQGGKRGRLEDMLPYVRQSDIADADAGYLLYAFERLGAWMPSGNTPHKEYSADVQRMVRQQYRQYAGWLRFQGVKPKFWNVVYLEIWMEFYAAYGEIANSQVEDFKHTFFMSISDIYDAEWHFMSAQKIWPHIDIVAFAVQMPLWRTWWFLYHGVMTLVAFVDILVHGPDD